MNGIVRLSRVDLKGATVGGQVVPFESVNALVNIGQKGVKVPALLFDEGDAFKKRVHEHGLARSDGTVKVQASGNANLRLGIQWRWSSSSNIAFLLLLLLTSLVKERFVRVAHQGLLELVQSFGSAQLCLVGLQAASINIFLQDLQQRRRFTFG